MVGRVGLEPTTGGLKVRYAGQLRHRPDSIGRRGRVRTGAPRVMSPPLCRLSYAPVATLKDGAGRRARTFMPCGDLLLRQGVYQFHQPGFERVAVPAGLEPAPSG